jgi:16S rRNA (guanine527-N7)-methyltransferase
MDATAVIAGLLHELEVPDGALSGIVAHARGVARDADRLGLTAERELEQILVRHSADSLLFALARRPAAGEAWLDVGSGAGFPGLVLAIAFPEARFTLVEPQARRAGFLELESLNLGLTNVEVARRRLETVPEASVDVVVARALEDPLVTHGSLGRLVRPGGCALVAAGPATPRPEGAVELRVSRPHVDSPGVLLMMPAES